MKHDTSVPRCWRRFFKFNRHSVLRHTVARGEPLRVGSNMCRETKKRVSAPFTVCLHGTVSE